MEVNGQELIGPAEVWMESEVIETSFVPLGADSDTRIIVFSEIQKTELNDVRPSENQKMRKTMDLQTLKTDHSDLVEAIVKEALAGMNEKLAEARKEGGTAENLRIKDVLAQKLPGHEAMVTELAFDGKTTGPEAAVAVLQAENKLRANTLTSLQAGAPPVIEGRNTDNQETMSEDDKLKAEWNNNQAIQAEFAGIFETFAAYKKELPGVKVKNQKRGGE